MKWIEIQGGTTAPAGFTAGGLHCGIKQGGEPDLAIVFSERPATLAGVFTRNLVKAAADLGMPAVALTDTGNMMGAFVFVREALSHNKDSENPVKPILGCEFYVCDNMKDRSVKDNGRQIVMLAKNKKGYHNLAKMASLAYIEGFYYVPRIDKELIRKLERFTRRDAKRAVRRGTRAGAKIVIPRARELAPVLKKRTKRRMPGLLRRAIRVRAAKRSRRYIGAVVILGAGFFKGETFYGAFQELGWKTGKRGSENRKQIPGKHFMERAAKEKEDEAVRVASEIILKEIDASLRA